VTLVRLALLIAIAGGCTGDDQAGRRFAGDGGVRSALPEPPDADLRPLPDLIVDRDRMASDLAIEIRDYAADACELDPQEDCIGGPGTRKLLRFAVETPNVGNADLVLGQPSPTNDQFVYSSCHDHYHFEGYAEFRLVDADGNDVALGHKQAFCLLDTGVYLTGDPTVSQDRKYWCGSQGIQRGWSDVYHTRLGCQFIDITDTPPGSYTLRVELNGARGLEELRYDNNLREIPVTIGDPALETPLEACDPALSDHALSTTDRECGWVLEETLDCPAGQPIRVACSACIGLGSCTGDAMLRVCEAGTDNCSNPAALGADDDACDACPHLRDIRCPASGQIDVYSAPHTVGEAYSCSPAVEAT
jgi:hypothetical protein